ncbi:MAG: 2-phospho-L-lactate transferase CofD family protein [bacterium]|nr:2-phospho-L-lactate transferase CofD family protein [bacterium]
MKKEVVTVGGGTGSPIVNRALIETGQVDFIKAVAAVYDSGGATGRRRLNSEGKEPAFSDAMRILLSLAIPNQAAEVIKRWFSDRDVRDSVLGQEIISRFFDSTGGYTKIESDLRTLGVQLLGTVLPSSTQSADIMFTTKSGRQYLGEHLLDGKVMSQDTVVDIDLRPQVAVHPPAAEAVATAETIILACGSPYGSMLCNFLPTGMREAVESSSAQVYLVTNLVSTRNETDEFSPQDYIDLVERFGVKIAGLVVPEMTRGQFEAQYPRAAYLYSLEGSRFLGWEDDQLHRVEAEGVRVITHQATRIIEVVDEKTTIVRHDASKLAEAFKKLLNP